MGYAAGADCTTSQKNVERDSAYSEDAERNRAENPKSVLCEVAQLALVRVERIVIHQNVLTDLVVTRGWNRPSRVLLSVYSELIAKSIVVGRVVGNDLSTCRLLSGSRDLIFPESIESENDEQRPWQHDE